MQQSTARHSHPLTSENLAALAEENFVERPYNCAEAILAAFAQAEGINPADTIGYATAFGKGIAGQGYTCGALTAGLMMLGRYGCGKGLDKKTVMKEAAAFYKAFEAEFGHTHCKILSGHDCDDPESPPFDLRTCGKYLRFATARVQEFQADHSMLPARSL
jgi:C_GCAxxG_C_C family probable redox protein